MTSVVVRGFKALKTRDTGWNRNVTEDQKE